MSVDFEHSIEIQRPAAEVFAFVSNPENNPRWQNGMVACTWTSEPLQVGATYRQEARFFGRPIHTHFEVVDYQPDERIEFHSTVSTIPLQITRRVEPAADGCRVTAHVRGQPTGVLKLFSGMVARSVARDYAKLKLLLESARPGVDSG
jgi:uncharacterized protein YndB with AHSA1/START domain